MGAGLAVKEKDSGLDVNTSRLVPSTDFQRHFAEHKGRADQYPLFVIEHNEPKYVFLSFEHYKQLLDQLAESEEEVLASRLDALERDPSTGIPWSKIRRTPSRE
jgi:PHD/YefM family antitoxin component YafN of YafNO toxin-antitoxin module